MRKIAPFMYMSFMFFSILLISCQNQKDASDQKMENKPKAQIEANTKKLLTAFLEEEDMGQVESLLDDAVKFHWPDKSVLDKNGLMSACRELTQKHDNSTEIIELLVDGNRAFILFVWSGEVMEDDNPALRGKKFSIHDCWYLTWEDGKITEWYTIWGSMDYLIQLGYSIAPPPMEEAKGD